MKRNLSPSGRTPRSFAFWRGERGFTVSGLIFAAAALIAAIAAYEGLTKKVPALQAAFGPLKNCKALVKGAVDGAIFNYAEKEEDGITPKKDPSGNVIFPPGLNIPENDPSVVALRQCQAIQQTFSDSVKSGNFQGIEDLNNQINTVLQFVGKCAITTNFRDGVAGINYGDVFEASINFSAGSQSTGSAVSVTGAAAGGGSFRSTNSPNWIGDVAVSADASKNAAGLTSQVIVTARTPALVPRNSQGGCPGASIEDNGNCVQIKQLDGTCPPGQFQEGDRCFTTCTTAAKQISWKLPDPPVIESFGVGPREIEKGSNASVQLAWVIKNASHASIDQGIGVVNPKTGFQPVIPTPQESTTYTITAIGLVPGVASASRSATLVVKEPDKPATVAITSPSEGDDIIDNGVTVSGVVVPVPDPAHRKAQILVNGAFLSEAVINDAGVFSTRTALQRTLTIGNIHVIGEPSVIVRSCGPRVSPIGVLAQMDGGARNLIQVIVPLANGQSARASVQVEHVAVVNNFRVDWFGCPPDNKNLARNLILRANADAVHVGDVSCGVQNTSGPFSCLGGATISIQTTALGTKQVVQNWDINVDKECP